MVIRYIEFIGSWISYYLLFGLLDFTGFSGSGSIGFQEMDAGCFSGIWIRTFGFGFGCLSSGLDSVGFQDLDAWIS